MLKIAISNQKGGVAKTTTAISLADALAGKGLRVLCIDLDPQANMTYGFGLDPEIPERNSFHWITNGLKTSEVTIPAGIKNISIIPSHITLAGAEKALYGQIGFDEIIREKLEGTNGYDVVVFDCPPSLGLLTINAVTASDIVLIPVQCEFFSAKGLEQVLEVVEIVKKRRNPNLKLRVLGTMYDRRTRICNEVLGSLRSTFNGEMFKTVIGIDTKIRESNAAGIPISRYAPKTRAARQYNDLAQELIRAEGL